MQEIVRHQFVQQGRHGDMRVVGDGVAKRQSAVCGQFGEETVRQRLYASSSSSSGCASSHQG